jgi:HK97 family phage portal protein
MERRSLFSKIFGNDKSTYAPATSEELELVEGYKASFTPYKGDFQNDPDVLACVDAIARNGAKMHPRHIRNYYSKEEDREKLENVRGNLYRILAKQPNEIQNAYKFYYDVITNLELYNNAFIYIQRDENYKVTGLYPLEYKDCKFYEYQDNIFIQFKFGRSKARYVSYKDCIHLTRFVGEDGLFGGSTEPIRKVLDIKHVLDEGIVNAIKTTQSIKGIIKSTKAMLKPEDVKKMRDQFVDDFVNSRRNRTGIGGLDATTDFIPVKIEPQTASESQVKSIDTKVLQYFGINENIIQSKYSEDEWNAFYESVLEPIGLQMSLEFSNKLFTATEKGFGNEILFESNRLQYASNKTKIELIRYASNILTINEQREVFNLTPVDNGDVFMIDQNHTINEAVSEEVNNEGN